MHPPPIVWRWEGEAFGNTPAQELAGVSVNLRFPGQYFDEETNLHYNWFRYYQPQLGRYITSDPVGLDGGANTFDYGRQNPISFTDPQGLNPYQECLANASDWTLKCRYLFDLNYKGCMATCFAVSRLCFRVPPYAECSFEACKKKCDKANELSGDYCTIEYFRRRDRCKDCGY